MALFLLISCHSFPHLDASESIPPARFGHSMVYDPVNERVLLFGGAVRDDGYTFFDELWVLDLAEGTWREVSSEPVSTEGQEGSAEGQDDEPGQTGIPGFPLPSIILSIVLIIMLWGGVTSEVKRG
jgi:hypothetical protein